MTRTRQRPEGRGSRVQGPGPECYWWRCCWIGIFTLVPFVFGQPSLAAAPAEDGANDAAEGAAAPAAIARANELWLTGKYAEAQEAYAALADEHPVEAALGQARCQASVGDDDKARATLAGALKQHAESADLLAALAEIDVRQGKYDDAQQRVDAALKLNAEQLQARWLAAELHRLAGRLEEADAGYSWLVDHYNRTDRFDDPEALRAIGLGAAQFARWRRVSDQFSFLVNELYPDALDLDHRYWPAAYESGRLYLEKFNQAEASRDLQAALELNPNAAEVYAAVAELQLQNYNLDEANTAIERALEINPRLLHAHLLKADAHFANFETEQAIEVLEEARELQPVSEELLGRLAAAYAVVDGIRDEPVGGRFDSLVEEVNERNPHAGEFYHALATTLDTTRRFPAAARYYREAIERMPQLVAPRNNLGLMYMRLGDEVEAARLLAEAFEVDPFNVRVSNQLKVLEVLEGYAVLETEHFVLKFDRVADGLLARYAARYLEEEVYPQLTESFGFEPEGKSLFEFFSRARNTSGHGWFSARMVGLPYVGTVGACAGKMVALASPNDMDEKFNWARVLKHEFVHVLNLQQSRFNIPHWYTEALAVQSEGYPRPQIWNQLLAERVPKGELFNLETINLGFVRPNSSLDWQMAYCQAQLYAQYMLETYGDDALAKMLSAYRDNLNTRDALKRSFNVEQEAFEEGYLAHLKVLAAELKGAAAEEEMSFSELVRAHEEKPDDLALSARLAEAYLLRRDYPEARKLAEQVLEQQPKHQLATYVLARIRLLVGDHDEALAMLQECLDRQSPHASVLRLLAALHFKAKRYNEAAELYELGAEQHPYDAQWVKSLAQIYLTSGDEQKLAAALTELARQDADDFLIRKKLASMALEEKDYEAAERWATEAIYIDVMDAQVHRMLALALLEQDDMPRAVEEYEVAAELAPNDAALLFSLAEAALGADLKDKARAALDKLERLKPDYPGAAELRERLAQ